MIVPLEVLEILSFIMVIIGAVGMLESRKMVQSILYFLMAVLGISLYLFIEDVHYLSMYLVVVYSGVAMIFILFMGMFVGYRDMKEGGITTSIGGWALVGMLFIMLSGFAALFDFPILSNHDIALIVFDRYTFALLLLGFLIFSALASVFSMVEEVDD